MSAFEALFAFYGLLLGLSIAAVASGFGEQWRRRRVRPIGFLVPLVGIYVLFAATHQWVSFYGAREGLAMKAVIIFMCLAMALPYTFVAQTIFPASDEDVANGDSHYLSDRRVFLGVLMIPLALSLTFNLIGNPSFFANDVLHNLFTWFVPLGILGALIIVRRRGLHVVGLVALIFNRLWAIVV